MTRLTYKDQRRLEELETLRPKLAAQIASHEERLADSGLYARDPKAFEDTMRALQNAEKTLADAEAEWFALEEKKEALG